MLWFQVSPYDSTKGIPNWEPSGIAHVRRKLTKGLREWSEAHGWMVDYLDAQFIKEEDLRKLRPIVFTPKG